MGRGNTEPPLAVTVQNYAACAQIQRMPLVIYRKTHSSLPDPHLNRHNLAAQQGHETHSCGDVIAVQQLLSALTVCIQLYSPYLQAEPEIRGQICLLDGEIDALPLCSLTNKIQQWARYTHPGEPRHA